MSARRRAFYRGAVLLGLAALLILVIDQLALDVNGVVRPGGLGWGGQTTRPSPWQQADRVGLAVDARDLTITIDGDELTAVYKLTAPAASPLAHQAIADEAADAGNDLVNSVLGAIQVAGFRYGFTGSEYVPVNLTFLSPVVAITNGTATITVSSNSSGSTVTVRRS